MHYMSWENIKAWLNTRLGSNLNKIGVKEFAFLSLVVTHYPEQVIEQNTRAPKRAKKKKKNPWPNISQL